MTMATRTPIYDVLVQQWATMDKARLEALTSVATAELMVVLADKLKRTTVPVTPDNAPEVNKFNPFEIKWTKKRDVNASNQIKIDWLKTPFAAKAVAVEATKPEKYLVDWTKAPAWANYHAFASFNKGFWFSTKPIAKYGFWLAMGENGEKTKWSESNFHLADATDWEKTLTTRVHTVDYSVDWAKAPAWANYHVFTKQGAGLWHRFQPVAIDIMWEMRHENGERGQLDESYFHIPMHGDWQRSLTKRPIRSVFDVDWQQAPEWARYHAYDSTGIGWWYAVEPVVDNDGWYISPLDKYVRFQRSFLLVINDKEHWRYSLRQRP